ARRTLVPVPRLRRAGNDVDHADGKVWDSRARAGAVRGAWPGGVSRPAELGRTLPSAATPVLPHAGADRRLDPGLRAAVRLHNGATAWRGPGNERPAAVSGGAGLPGGTVSALQPRHRCRSTRRAPAARAPRGRPP